MSKRKNYRIISMMLAVVMLVTTVLSLPVKSEAKSYMTVRAFIRSVAISLDLDTDGTSFKAYRKAAKKAGIVKDEDSSYFTDYKNPITRTYCAVVLNRVDQYLHGDTLDSEYVTTIKNERISDMNSIASTNRDAVARVYGLGIIKGYSNGNFTRDREFRGSEKVGAKTAKQWINATVNPEQREKLSPDGQLLRTTNLPKNSDKFEYILASFPNSFYEYRFEFERNVKWNTDKWIQKYLEDYCYPIDMDKYTVKAGYDVQEQMEKYMDEWVECVEEYLSLAMNVDYRTINEKWVKDISKTFGYTSDFEGLVEDIEEYVTRMKKSKIMVETKIIEVEPSSFHVSAIGYTLRAYVRYRVFTPDTINQDIAIFAPGHVWIEDMESGVWKDAYFDIILFPTENFIIDLHMGVDPVIYLNYRK